VTTALLAVIGSGAWYVLPVLWAVVPAVNVLNFARVPLMPAVAEQERLPLKKLLTSKLFILAILLMICSGASEQAMSQWASLFAERGLGVSKVMGDLLGPCLFAICMGVGRTLFGVLGERIRLSWALVGCAVLCVACYLVAALAKNPLLALLGCAVTGFAVSLMWPGVLSLSARTFPMGGTAVFSLLALGGDIGCAVGPWLTGAVSDVAQSGLRGGLLAAVLFPLGLAAGVLLFVRPLRRAAKERA
jgi:Fucose permease